MKTTQKQLTGRDIDAMTPTQKKALVEKYERTTPAERRAAARPPTAEEVAEGRELARRIRRGRPKLGKGTRVVSVTVEIDLLRRADAYARKVGLKRAELFTQGLKSVVPAE